MQASSDRVVNALKRLAKEVGYMLEAPPRPGLELIVTGETQLAFDEAVKALQEVGEKIGE
ncbi:hypothetical protein LCGC14_1957120 [marine sediment metagenome]|uniref:Uncharacterized protein n=1 Tax=marine sediment metagenome TaxID=412755 RepID=A0A0F9FFX5_9ZZZZ